MDYKQLIIDFLDIMRKKEQVEKETFKERAYQKVINQLKEHSTSITSYEDVMQLKGIGDKISKKIKEILETGSLRSAERVQQNYNIEALDAFQAIYDVGPMKASDLIKQGYTTIEQLREAIKTNSKLLHGKQQIGLKYYEDLLERIPRQEMEEHDHLIHILLPDTLNAELVGSYRRHTQTSGDIDVLIRVPQDTPIKQAQKEFDIYIKILHAFGYIKEILAHGDKKFMGICNASHDNTGKARRLDLLLTPAKEYAYAILYFTGSDKFNVAFRQHALNMGYTLNEHNLTPLREDIPTPPFMEREEDIFRFLHLKFVKPEDRIDGSSLKPVRFKRPPIATSTN